MVKKSAKKPVADDPDVLWVYDDHDEDTPETSEAKAPLSNRILSVIGWILWIVAVYFLANLLMAAIILLLHHYGLMDIKNPSTIAVGVINAAMYVLMFAIAVLLPLRLGKKKRAQRSTAKTIMEQSGLLRRPKLVDLSYFVANLPVFYMVSIAASALATYLLGSNIMGQEQPLDFAKTSNEWWQLVIIFITYVIVAPLFEEVMMRGFLFGKLRKNMPFWPTAILVSLLFAVAHGQINVGIMTFVMSMFACRMREKTGAAWGGIFLHAFSNGLAFVLLFILN